MRGNLLDEMFLLKNEEERRGGNEDKIDDFILRQNKHFKKQNQRIVEQRRLQQSKEREDTNRMVNMKFTDSRTGFIKGRYKSVRNRSMFEEVNFEDFYTHQQKHEI
jgi:hypothetical protein